MVRGVKSDIEAFRLTIFDLRKFFNMSTFNEAVYPENSIELVCLFYYFLNLFLNYFS